MTDAVAASRTGRSTLIERVRREHFFDYNRGAAVYWFVMVVLGAAALAWAVVQVAGKPRDDILQVVAGVLCAMAAGLFPVQVPRSKNYLAAGEIVIFLLLLLQGAPAAVLAAAVEAGVGSIRAGRRMTSRVASPALAAVAMAVVGSAFDAARHSFGPAIADAAGPLLGAVIVLALAYAVLNTLLQTAIFMLKGTQPVTLVPLLSSFGWIGLLYAASACVSMLIYLSFRELGYPVLVAVVPIIAALLTGLHLHFRVVVLDAEAQRQRVEAAEREAAQTARHLHALQASEQRFHSAFTHASIGMALVAPNGDVRQVNPALALLLGCTERQLTDMNVQELVAADDQTLLDARLARLRDGDGSSFSLELRCLHSQGHEVWVALHGGLFVPHGEADERMVILQMQDITARRIAEARLQHIAYHDGLTDLANRLCFIEHLQTCIDLRDRNPQSRFGVLFLDFDRFKLINDSLGHHIGDEFLSQVSERIRGQVRSADLVARLGGDEFAVLMRDIDSPQQPVLLAERLQACLRQPFVVAGHELITSASIGICVPPPDGARTPQDILRDADTAMYRAKAAGKGGWAVFDDSMHAQVAAQLQLERDLRHALQQDAIQVVFQPIFELSTSSVTGFEALARWPHPRRGPIDPATFLPAAEEAGLITRLTHSVLDKVFAQVHGFEGVAGLSPLKVNVNVTALDLCQRDFAPSVGRALQRHGLQPQQLTLELTEHMLMENLEAALGTMNELRELGVGLCVDDFGTGYSSLSYLSSLPINSLKIDARFVQQLDAATESNEATEIVRAIVRLGDALGKRVIAEGIEQPHQLEKLKALGCDQGQGFLLCPPLDAATLQRRWVDRGALWLVAA